jgi:hypothetical protein
MRTWREDVETVLRELGGQASLTKIYTRIRKVRTSRLPKNWRAATRQTLETHSSHSANFGGKYDLFYSVDGLGRGVWGLRALEPVTATASDVGNPSPGRVETTTYRILRDTRLARALKRLYRDRCQLCGATIRAGGGKTYSEAHHLRPLGGKHRGPDVLGNIVVLCPNHHALLDYGGVELSRKMFKYTSGHKLDDTHLNYHNKHIWIGATRPKASRSLVGNAVRRR